jgi:hypothetical protein
LLSDILNIWSPDNGDDYALVADLARIVDDVEGAILSPPYVRITGTADATMASTDHPLQIGPTAGVNLIIDNNEIIARNGGANNGLGLNLDGGNVGLGNSESIISIPGHINGAAMAWAMAGGSLSMGSIAAGTEGTQNVTFPSGKFSTAPILALAVNSSIPHLRATSVTSVSSTGFTVVQRNDTGSTSSAAVSWIALQMTSSSAGG